MIRGRQSRASRYTRRPTVEVSSIIALLSDPGTIARACRSVCLAGPEADEGDETRRGSALGAAVDASLSIKIENRKGAHIDNFQSWLQDVRGGQEKRPRCRKR